MFAAQRTHTFEDTVESLENPRPCRFGRFYVDPVPSTLAWSHLSNWPSEVA